MLHHHSVAQTPKSSSKFSQGKLLNVIYSDKVNLTLGWVFPLGCILSELHVEIPLFVSVIWGVVEVDFVF
jgi:hypothetical protein